MKRFVLASLFISLLLIGVRSQTQVQGRVFWKGTVDAKIHLIIKGDKIETKTMDGKEYPDGVYSFTMPLPDSPVKVGIKKTDGRGFVSVIQQPAEDNQFTAIVEIIDPKGGAKEYQLEIFWQ
ncbi:MAG: hypothetical protein ACRD43_06100 [Pyrinomonadaceae bacterium]